jgi:threonine/homoserine/homoserine lactone efflux protein
VLWTFVPIAALMTIAPGPATAMVVRSSLRGGWRAGVLTVAGNAVGVVAWALLSVLGVSALVAASQVAFVALKVGGAALLVWFGLRMLLDRGTPVAPREASRGAFRDGLVTSLANPKLAVFFVALFPQFLDGRAAVLPTALLMAALIVTFDFAWYTSLAVAVSRARAAVASSRAFRWVERVMGAALIALGARLALEQR